MMKFSLILPLFLLSLLLLPNVIFVKAQKVLYTVQFGSKGDDTAHAIAVRKSSSSVVVTLAGELSGPLHFEKKDDKNKTEEADPSLPISDDEILHRLLLQSPNVPEVSNTSVRMFTGATGIDWLAPPKVVILDMMVNQSDGSTYLTGSVFADSSSQKPLGESDILFVKYSDDGSRLFFQQSGTTRFDQGESLAMDSLGYVYVTGVTTGSLDEQVAYGNQDIFLLKYDWMGRKIWTKQYGTAEDDEGKSVAVDPLSQDIFMTGYSYGDLHGEQNEGNSDLFLLKVRSGDGKTLFTKLYGTVGFDGGRDIVIDPSYGDIYISGSVDGTLDSQQAVLIKYDRNGTEVWDKYLDPRDVSYAMTMVMDSQHCLYLLGYVHRSFVEYNTVGRSDIVLQKYDEMGKLLYSTSYGSGGEDRGRDCHHQTSSSGIEWASFYLRAVYFKYLIFSSANAPEGRLASTNRGLSCRWSLGLDIILI
eukprot:scaffold615_cov216-Ochromonas_danica.AAC.2